MKFMPSEETGPKLEDLTFDELNAVLVHKWFLSERECRDVGMEYAVKDFFNKHVAQWRDEKMKDDFRQQKEEILKHKWYLSEKTGREIGMTEAGLDWVNCGFAEHWRNGTGPYKKKLKLPKD